jgi:ribonuclease P protein subunit POP4
MTSNFTKELLGQVLENKKKTKADDIFAQQVKMRALNLEPLLNTKPKERKKKVKPKIRKSKGVIRSGLKYADFVPINYMWNEYIKSVLAEVKGEQDTMERLLKVDLHGADIEVVKSTNHSVIGVRGIVAQEKMNVFSILQSNDEIKVVPKKNCVFRLCCKATEGTWLIYGNEFCVRPAERLTKKWKNRPTIDLK